MRKIKKFTMVVICFVFLFLITGCGNKTAITSENFKNRMESSGYTVKEATDQMSENEDVKQIYIAINKDSTYQIEFYELTDSDSATCFFNNNKAILENSKSSSSTETSVSVGNNDKYMLTTNGEFKAISRIDNTVIYSDVENKYKDLVKDVLDNLGY